MRNLSFMEHIFIFQYKEYEQVVVEDRIEKEKARRKADQEAIELRAAIRVRQLSKQNHWLLLLSLWLLTRMVLKISPWSYPQKKKNSKLNSKLWYAPKFALKDSCCYLH